jgi:hypothetical protein
MIDAAARFQRRLDTALIVPALVLVLKTRPKKIKPKLAARISSE